MGPGIAFVIAVVGVVGLLVMTIPAKEGPSDAGGDS